MSQELMDMIARMGGTDAIAAMAARVGIPPAQAESAVAALVPALSAGMANQAASGNTGLVNTLSGIAASMTGSAASDQAVAHGTDIVSQIFGSHDVTQAVTERAAATSGVSPGQLAALLPMVATLAASALGNGTGTVAAPASGGIGGMLGGLLGSLTGGGATSGGAAGALLAMLDANKDGSPFDDILGMAGKFMKH
jgi:hypothetical protein